MQLNISGNSGFDDSVYSEFPKALGGHEEKAHTADNISSRHGAEQYTEELGTFVT
jgi:hypothetical protein